MLRVKEGNIVKHDNGNFYVVVSTGLLFDHLYTCLLADIKDPEKVILQAMNTELQLVIEEETEAFKVLFEDPKDSKD